MYSDALLGHRLADHQRADAVRIAECEQTIAGDARHHRVGAAAAPVHAGHGREDGIGVELVAVRALLQLVRQHVEQHLRIRAGVDVPQVLPEQLALELLGIGEIAVVAEHDAERRVDVQRLRLGRVIRRAGGGIAAMRDADVAEQRAHVARAEHVAHQAAALVHVEFAAFGGDDPGGVLPAVLQHQQPVVQQLVDGRLGDDADDSTHTPRALRVTRPTRSHRLTVRPAKHLRSVLVEWPD